MAATAQQGGATFSVTIPILRSEQMAKMIASWSGGNRKPKAKEPDVYRGEWYKLRGWLAQLIVYYRTVGWQNGHDEENILYSTSLILDDAGTWITPYTEGRITPRWDNWAGFKAELQRQFGVIDVKGEARMRMKNMKQGKWSVREYWNEFHLLASETELDDWRGGELLWGGMNTELQNAGGATSEEYKDLEDLAQWTIQKETKLATVRHIQGGPGTKTTKRETITSRNPHGTYRPTNNGKQNCGPPMELHARRRQLRFNILWEELKRRMGEQLSLKCAQRGHLARTCPKKDRSKGFNAQDRNWPNRAKIREIEVEQKPEQAGTDECPHKAWSEGQTRRETHHHGKLLRGTQLHGNPRTRQWPYYG